MKVKVLKGGWNDIVENIKREVGDEFICSKNRFKEINDKLEKYGKGPWIKEVIEKK